MKLPRITREEIDPLTEEESCRLLAAAPGERFEALYVLAINTGMRQGELLALKWEDVDLEGGRLRARRTLTQTRLSSSESRSRRIAAEPSGSRRVRSLPCRPTSPAQIGAFKRVGDSGFEPLTSSASRKRSPPELIALTLRGRPYAAPRGGTRNRTGVQGFADPCLTTRPCRQRRRYDPRPERKTGFEPATLTMAR